MIMMYGREDCPLCDQAKNLLEEAGLDYTYIDIDVNEGIDVITGTGFRVPESRGMNYYRRVPQIFDQDSREIGGYDELVIWLSETYPVKATMAGVQL